MSGRHSKPTLRAPRATEIKAVGGIIAGAAVAGAIAASAAFTTPDTAPDPAPDRLVSGVALFRADERPLLSPHEAHVKHKAHARHKARGSRPDGAKDTRAKSSRPSRREANRARRASAQQVIKLARSQVGTSENRSGVSKFNRWYMDDSRALRTLKRDGGSRSAYRDAAWCDMFVSWVGHRLGISQTLGFDAYTVKHAEWFKQHGRWGQRPRPGSVVFFGTGNNIDDIQHVGFTIKDNGNGTIKTVEGNTNDTVAVRTRPKSFVIGYGYPDYRK
ncbi:MAG TPA: CHAP domain-containing protein [Streptosporangiaceae bacterium]|nr:CHAP domain-containing protein [Streptosporangiaceae bacterium]